MRFRSIALLALLALATASCGGGAPMASGPSEGIQIHGDWTIDVFNEDGSLADHVEFSNGLAPSGTRVLACSLIFPEPFSGGDTTDPDNVFCDGRPVAYPGSGLTPWILYLGDRDLLDPATGEVIPGSSPCATSYQNEGPSLHSTGCAIHDETLIRKSEGPVGDGTDIASQTSGDGVLVLSGSFEAPAAGAISFVESQVEGYTEIESSGFFTSHVFTFTSKDIDPVLIKAGQTVQVEVEISFTSG